MKKAGLWIFVAVLVILGLWMWSTYNGLVSSRENVDREWAQVETQYQRRADLIPNLVSTVKGAAEFEQETFTAVTEARTQWQSAGSRSDSIAAAGAMDSALARLLLTFENYPELQATQAYRDLMTQLEGTENRIAVARRDYNQTVRNYNVLTKRFPTLILANMFGYDPEAFFEAAEGSDEAPSVEF